MNGVPNLLATTDADLDDLEVSWAMQQLACRTSC